MIHQMKEDAQATSAFVDAKEDEVEAAKEKLKELERELQEGRKSLNVIMQVHRDVVYQVEDRFQASVEECSKKRRCV